MAVTSRMGQRHAQVADILNDINESIGSSSARDLVDEDAATYVVPRGLRRAVARTALHMLQEMAGINYYTPKRKRAYQAYLDGLKSGETPLKARQFHTKDDPGASARLKSRDAAERKDKKRRKKKVASKTPQPPAEDRADDKDVDKTYLDKHGKKMSLMPGLSRMGKRRREGKIGSGGPTKRPGRSVADKVASLRKADERLGAIGAKEGRGSKTAPPGMPPGFQRPMRQPVHGTIPSEFRAHQRRKGVDLDALEKERQRRSPGVKGGRERFMGPLRAGELPPRIGHKAAGLTAKAGKLARMRGRHPSLRNREHDTAKGYDKSPPPVHSSGKKSNKKFANATTFRDSDDDAMLHTDRSHSGSRASADTSEFAFHGNTEQDPRQKWYRVSKEGGYASAMASLRKVYGKSKAMRNKVVSKVKSTGFADSSGHQINVKPTGSLHNERGACVRKPGPKDQHGNALRDSDGNKIKGPLTAVGKALKKRDPSEFYRLCKGTHDDVGGTKKGRSEYERGFDPRHDDASKVNRLHKAAELGKADKPTDNIKTHMVARGPRRGAYEKLVRGVGAHAERRS